MVQSDTEASISSHSPLLQRTSHRVASGFKEQFAIFSDFALRDNVLEVAVGLIVASAFTGIVNSFINNILLPPISLLPGLGVNLDGKFVVLRAGQHERERLEAGGYGRGYNTSSQALDDGAVIMVWGDTISKVLNFFGTALALFVIARIYEVSAHDRVIKRTVKCKYCRKYISIKAKRCVNCTSWVDGREGHTD